ncbi:MAG: MFS transporter, partial [Ramlibacter sp.]
MPERPIDSAPTAAPDDSLSAFAPLGQPVFRMLWITWLAANTTMWMNDVAAAWLMTSLTPSPLWVALVQSASTLPVFLLGLPSGALADIMDRRRYFMFTQFWVAGNAVLVCTMVILGWMTAPLLLALTFANGVGLAMRWPVFAAIIPEVVPRPQLPAALALNGVAMNASRIIGPLAAGAIIASISIAWVFVLNAVLSVFAGFIIMRWRREHKESPLGRERLTSAMRVGVQFVWQSVRMRAVLLRISLFFLHSTALLALLPLVARALPGGAAGTFTVLLASMGAGAITAALLMTRIRRLMPLERLLLLGTTFQSIGAVVVAYAPNIYVASPAMAVAGMAWITVANS